jgi:hypothetical protein
MLLKLQENYMSIDHGKDMSVYFDIFHICTVTVFPIKTLFFI